MRKFLVLGLISTLVLALGIPLAMALPASPPAKDNGLQPLEQIPVYYDMFQGVGDDPADFSSTGWSGLDEDGTYWDTSGLKVTPNGKTVHDVLAFFQSWLIKKDYVKPYVLVYKGNGLYMSEGEVINYQFAEDLPEEMEELEGKKRRAVVTTWLKLDADGQFEWMVLRADYYTRGEGPMEYFITNIYPVWDAGLGKEMPEAVSQVLNGLINAGAANLGGQRREVPNVRAGVSKKIITPTKPMMNPDEKGPVYLGGYGDARTADPDQVWDNLWARTMVVEAGGDTVAFTGVDSVGLLYSDIQEIKKKAREELGKHGLDIDRIIIASTHTHHAPDTIGLWGPDMVSGVNPYYEEFLIEKSAESIVEATMNMKPVKEIRLGKKETSGLHRDTRLPNVMNDKVYVMHVMGRKNQTIGTLVKWSAHPETVLGYYDNAITSDYVHHLRETVENKVGGTTVFLNGAIGGLITTLNVNVDYGIGKGASKPTMRYIGKQVGEKAVDAIQNSEKSKVKDIDFAKEDLFIPLQNPNYYLAGYYGILQRDVYVDGEKLGYMPLPPELGGTAVDIKTEISIVNIGDAQFALVPGELYPEIAYGGYKPPERAQNPEVPTEPIITEHMTGQYKFIIGLANDEIGYIIPANDFVPLVRTDTYWDEGMHRILGKELYGESNSVGPRTAPIIAGAMENMLTAMEELKPFYQTY